MKVRYIKSQLKNSCVVASLAMVTGKTFNQTLRGLKEFWQEEGQFQGVKDEIFDAYLGQLGYAVRYIKHDYSPRFKLRKEWPPKPFAPIHVCDVFDEGLHAVVMLEDGKVLDPNDVHKKSLADYQRVFTVAGIYPVGEPFPEP